jgi:hypothetical protein
MDSTVTAPSEKTAALFEVSVFLNDDTKVQYNIVARGYAEARFAAERESRARWDTQEGPAPLPYIVTVQRICPVDINLIAEKEAGEWEALRDDTLLLLQESRKRIEEWQNIRESVLPLLQKLSERITEWQNIRAETQKLLESCENLLGEKDK